MLNTQRVVISEVEGQIFARGLPRSFDSSNDTPDRQKVLDWIAEAGFADCVVDEAGVQQLVDDCASRTTPFVVMVAQRMDATIAVEVSADAMSAAVSLSPPKGGRPASIDDVLRALNSAGVSIGVDHDVLMAACQAGIAEKLVVAHGLPPVEGADCDFLELVPQSADRAPKVNENGLIDYRDHGAIALVEVDAPLMRRIPPVPGTPGHTVLGQPIAPQPVRDAPFASDLLGAKVSSGDPDLLIATSSGLPVRVPCGVMVEPVLKVREVNLATGNINFDGTVQVEGDVINQMKVLASGDIVVGGTVEGAALQAGGNIAIKGGVIFGASLEAAGMVSARFAQNSKLTAGSILALDDAALECALQSGNQITIGVKNPQRGRLAGGTARTKMLLKVPLLGSPKGSVTKVEVGADPELERQYQLLSERIQVEKTNEENLQKLCQHLVAIKDPKGMLDRAKTAWRQAAQLWGKSLAQRLELDKQRESIRNARLEITVETAGPVQVTFGSTKLVLQKHYGAGALSIDKDAKIVFTQPDGKAFAAQ